MKTATDYEIGKEIRLKANKRRGKVIGNKLSCDQHLAVEWENGELGKIHVNAVDDEFDSLEEEFEQLKVAVNAKLAEAAHSIRQAALLAESKGKDLIDPDGSYGESEFETDLIEHAMSAAGWRTSSWYC